MRILGIETSCDETAVCLIEGNGEFGADFRFTVLGNGLASQAAQHAEYGGVFPNLAKREHGKNLVPMLEIALRESNELNSGTTIYGSEMEKILERETELLPLLKNFLENHAKPDIDVIAVTVGPGLEPALWVGVNFARALSVAWNVPIIAANHMEGHIIISLARNDEVDSKQLPVDGESKIPKKSSVNYKLSPANFPALALLISGGHTELVLMHEFPGQAGGAYEYLGRTRDDAVGEAFDKVARMLGTSYPGGPHVSRLAEEARSENKETRFTLPRPMLHENSFDFSFAGLKTAVLRLVEAEGTLSNDFKKTMAREFEDAVAEVLVEKTMRAAEERSVQTLIVGGGVSANKHIRKELERRVKNDGIQLLLSAPEFATDNAVMIALAGYFHALKKEFIEPDSLHPDGNLKLSNKS